jgi:hypothetical protein
MSSEHRAADGCLRMHPADMLIVVGFDNPVAADDLSVGDIVFDPKDGEAGTLLLIIAVEQPSSVPVVHAQTEYADWDQVAERIKQVRP